MKNLIYLMISACFVVSSCKDVFESDISDKKVLILAPADNIVSSSATITFWWQMIKDVDYYDLQIVRGSFSSVSQLIADTVVNGDKFVWTLTPGLYEWRVRGVNNSSTTDWTLHSLTVDSTQDLSVQSLLLISPGNDYITNQNQINFSWQELYNASSYRIQMIDNIDSSLLVDDLVSGIVYGFSFSDEGSYTWRVRAENTTSFTPFSSRLITIDRTAPSPPYALRTSQANDMLTAGVDSIFWNSDVNSFSDSLFVYEDSLVSPPFIQLKTTFELFQIPSGLNTGDYYFRLSSMDEAGNVSSYSTTRKFIIQ